MKHHESEQAREAGCGQWAMNTTCLLNIISGQADIRRRDRTPGVWHQKHPGARTASLQCFPNFALSTAPLHTVAVNALESGILTHLSCGDDGRYDPPHLNMVETLHE